MLSEARKPSGCPKIHLPNGEASTVSHLGYVELENELKLRNVMCTPAFRHNLISVQKFTQKEGCKVTFLPTYCVIEDIVSGALKGVGKAVKGIYYLIDRPMSIILSELRSGILQQKTTDSSRTPLAASSELEIPSQV